METKTSDYFNDHLLEEKFPIRIKHTTEKGRTLIATRNVSAGELLFSESALISGPAKGNSNCCIRCFKRIKNSEVCIKCGYPTCAERCSRFHSLTSECQIISQHVNRDEEGKILVDAILPLRCLLMKNLEEEKWNYFRSFQSHIQVLIQYIDYA